MKTEWPGNFSTWAGWRDLLENTLLTPEIKDKYLDSVSGLQYNQRNMSPMIQEFTMLASEVLREQS